MNTSFQRGGLAGDEARWRHHLALYSRKRAQILSVDPQPAEALELLRAAMERAGAAAALDDRPALLDALFESATAGAAAMLGLRFSEGRIVFSLKETAPRSIPSGLPELPLPLWANAVYAACLVRDGLALEILCAAGHPALAIERAAQGGSPVGREPYWAPFCLALAACVRNEPGAAENAEQARRLLTPNDSTAASQGNAALKISLVELIANLARGETGQWTEAVAAAVAQFDQFYADEQRAFFSSSFLPLGIAALCALAVVRGVPFQVESPYLPAWLIRGESERRRNEVVYEYPRRRARDAREIHWWFDLEGIPRQDREHRLIQEAGALVACYEVCGPPGVPDVRAKFVLDDSANSPLLLDAGELLLVADLQARQVEAEPQGPEERLRDQRFHLAEAIAALDAILALIPEGESAVPARQFHTERGRTLWQAEPGRFEVSRLRAVRAAYEKILSGIDARLRGPGDSAATPVPDEQERRDEAARPYALASIELIKTQVAPLLEALARDASGEVAQMLKPRAEDYEKVFVGEAVAVARAAYDQLWAESPFDGRPSAHQTELRCYVAPAGMLAEENELSHHFPGGYRAIARWLNPHRIWVAWKFVAPGQPSGMAYNGLVWIDDRWAWFPKPYRVLAPLSP